MHSHEKCNHSFTGEKNYDPFMESSLVLKIMFLKRRKYKNTFLIFKNFSYFNYEQPYFHLFIIITFFKNILNKIK